MAPRPDIFGKLRFRKILSFLTACISIALSIAVLWSRHEFLNDSPKLSHPASSIAQKRYLSESLAPIEHNHRQKRIRNEPRGTSLSSHATRQNIQTARSSSKLDNLRLPPDETIVISREAPRSSQSEYEHINPSGWENERLQSYGLESQIRLGLRCFLDAFYIKCGYVNIWDQTPQNSPNPNYPSRSAAVYRNLRSLNNYGIYRKHLPFLVGPDSHYKENHQYIHDLPLPLIGAAMSKWSRNSKSKWVDAYLLVWTFLTGYKKWQEGEDDERYLGTSGVSYDKKPEDDPEDIAFDAEKLGLVDEIQNEDEEQG